ncbi:MAG: DinB family protein [Thermomicrobiales bacterium]
MLENTMADVTDEIANRPAPGDANPLGASYAHVLLAEDAIVNGMLKGAPPLAATSWAGRTGVDRPMPMPTGMAESDLGEWYHSAHVNLAACRAYAQAVYANSADFLSTADAATLARGMDMPMMGMGMLPLAIVFQIFVIGHCNNLCGEVSAVKGSFGLKGYPF